MVNVASDQVLLRSHILCNRTNWFPPNIEVIITQRTDECFEDRG